MKKFIEKLIGRLEELKTFKLDLADAMSELMKKDRLDNYVSKEEVVEIVNQLAEEYKSGTLCYLGSPCEYQNKDIRVDDNKGWIPCSERLPEDGVPVVVTVKEDNDNGGYDLYVFESWYPWYQEGEWAIGKSRYNPTVIAWQPLPAPFEPKGEQQ